MTRTRRNMINMREQSVWVASFIFLVAVVVVVLLFFALRFVPMRSAVSPTFAVILISLIIVCIDVAVCVVTQALLYLTFLRRRSTVIAPTADATECPDPPLTAFVVPALLKDEATARRLIAKLESHAKSNLEPRLYLGLLTDFSDASVQRLPSDDQLLEIAIRGIELLNRHLPDGSEPRFFLLHRNRTWSPAQVTWMGHERKRGKLNDLNDYIATGNLGRFTLAHGAASSIVGASFVITLDEDNELVPGGAQVLIRHMMNHSHDLMIDRQRRSVAKGHAILQPFSKLPDDFAASTRFQRMLGYCWSDAVRLELVYELLFGEGSFIGKGIYSVDAFRAVLGNRFPDDTILAHDIIEGCFLRSRMVTDVYMTECPPSGLEEDMTRTHRWNRGDWQSWIFALRRDVRDELSLLSHLKLVDNARRALVPGAVLALIMCALLEDSRGYGLVSFVIVLRLIYLFAGWLPPSTAELVGQREVFMAQGLAQRSYAELMRAFLYFTVVPSLAWNTLSAAAKATWRLFVSGKYTLEWKTASASADESRHNQGLLRHVVLLAPNVCAVTLVGALGLIFGNIGSLGWLLVFLWSVGPLLSWGLSRTIHDSRWD